MGKQQEQGGSLHLCGSTQEGSIGFARKSEMENSLKGGKQVGERKLILGPNVGMVYRVPWVYAWE